RLVRVETVQRVTLAHGPTITEASVPTTLLTPMDRGKARQSGATLWRKQLLPLGEITYEGRKIAFSREYLAGLVKAFADKAYDVVPFQFAGDDNKHTNKVEQ